ncbi:MAG: uroporphyrinogen decarboxylase family protein, partial [Anaerolineae bacterium]
MTTDGTIRQAIMNMFAGQTLDFTPNFSGMGSITLHGIQQLGYKFNEVHLDAEKMAAAAASSYKLFGLHSAVVPFDMGIEAEALGATVKYYDKGAGQIIYPTMTGKLVSRSQVQIPPDLPENKHKSYLRKAIDQAIINLNITPPADLAHAGRIPVVLEAIRILKDDVGSQVPVASWVLGPFTLAGQIMELENLLKLTFKKRDVVNRHLSHLTDYLTDILNLYIDAGADFVTVREMGATGDLLSRKMFGELIQPHLTELFSRITRVPTVLHICGNTNTIVDLMAQCGPTAISIDQKNNLAETRAKLPGTLIFGNYDPFGTLCEGTPADVDAGIKTVIQNGADAVWPGCDIWPSVAPENMKAMMDATQKYGAKT